MSLERMIDKTSIIEGENNLGENCLIGPYCSVNNIKLGRGSKLFKYVNAYGCELGKDCKVGGFTEIQSDVKIGNNVTISSHSFICSFVTIEDDAWLGHGIRTINDIYPPSRKRTGSDKHWKPTHIGRGAIIGTNAVLFPVNIGDYAFIGAGSVVKKDVPSGQVWVGSPAKYISDSKDLKYEDGTWVFPELRE